MTKAHLPQVLVGSEIRAALSNCGLTAELRAAGATNRSRRGLVPLPVKDTRCGDRPEGLVARGSRMNAKNSFAEAPNASR